QQRQKTHRFSEVILLGLFTVYSKPPTIWQRLRIQLRNSRPQLPVKCLIGIRSKRHEIETGKPHDDLQTGRNLTNAGNYFPQEPGPVFKASAVLTLSSMRAEEFMPEITMTMFHV